MDNTINIELPVIINPVIINEDDHGNDAEDDHGNDTEDDTEDDTEYDTDDGDSVNIISLYYLDANIRSHIKVKKQQCFQYIKLNQTNQSNAIKNAMHTAIDNSDDRCLCYTVDNIIITTIKCSHDNFIIVIAIFYEDYNIIKKITSNGEFKYNYTIEISDKYYKHNNDGYNLFVKIHDTNGNINISQYKITEWLNMPLYKIYRDEHNDRDIRHYLYSRNDDEDVNEFNESIEPINMMLKEISSNSEIIEAIISNLSSFNFYTDYDVTIIAHHIMKKLICDLPETQFAD